MRQTEAKIPDQETIPSPIYKRLFEQYREAIFGQEFPPGARIDSINELMQKHGISRETAKLVLKKLAEEGLIVRQVGKGSFVSDMGPRKGVWGVVVPHFSAQIMNVLTGLEDRAVQSGRTLEPFVSYNSWKEEIRLVGMLVRRQYEAVIVVPTFDETETAPFYKNLDSGRSLVLLLDHTMAGSYFAYVIQSYDLGVNRAVQYLLRRSPHALAFVRNTAWTGRNLVQELMEATFRDAVETALPPVRALVVDRLQELTADWIFENRINGIFCCDDLDATGVVGRLKEWGVRIPDEVSVIGYGNTELARYFTPAITAIDGHGEEMAQKTAEIIFLHNSGQGVRQQQHVILPSLVVRET
jgi:DNA-binding LacI/PurR family transcriptional regulator